LTFNYNAGGQLSTVTTPSGTYNYSYDSAGRLSNLTESATGINLSYAYDGTLPLSTTWTGPVTGDVSRTYDNNFRVVSQSVNGANTVNYAYDNDGLLTSAGDLSLTRDAENGLLSATTLGTVSDAWTYNQFGEPTNYTAKDLRLRRLQRHVHQRRLRPHHHKERNPRRHQPPLRLHV
jgi:hypothetical protein